MDSLVESMGFDKSGFEIIDILNIDPIIEIRDALVAYLANKYSLTIDNSERFLNHFHELAPIKDDAAANSMVLDLISSTANTCDFAESIFDSISPFLLNLIGPDIMAQKNNNIVFQYPGSKRFSELHTDVPANSEFELVTWTPLVNCYASKSFYIVPLNHSIDLVNKFKSNKFSDWDEFKSLCLQYAIHVNVNFSQCLVFWSGLVHGSLINLTNESRWCLNVRYKGLFSPCGQHDPLTYYKPLRSSALTNFAINAL